MRLPAAVLSVVLILLLSACEERAPLNRSLAASIADSYQQYQSVNWGDPTEVLAPTQPDEKGLRWWQLRYRSGAEGERRMILVDDASGWARFPAADYVERVAPVSRPDAAHPLQISEGHCILRLAPARPADESRRIELEREVIRLNTLAGQTGLVPLFSLRRYNDGQVCIIYGWQIDRGMARDEKVRDWVKTRTRYGEETVWEDLVAER